LFRDTLTPKHNRCEVRYPAPTKNHRIPQMPRQKTKTQFFQKEIFLIVCLFLLAFVIRLIYLKQIKLNPYFDTPQLDALWHHNQAKEISAGDFLGKEVFFRAPLYPYFLGTLYALFGESFYLPRLIQIIIGSLNCVLIFFFAKKLFNRTIGIVASVIACFYAPFIYFDAELLTPVLVILLDLTLILLLLGAEVRLRKRWWFLAGIVIGLSAMALPNTLIFVPFVLLWIFLKFWRENKNRIVWSGILFLFGMILVISPVTLRNWIVGKDFVLVSSQGGINFFMGNNIESDGKTATTAPGFLPYDGDEDNIRMSSTKLAEKGRGEKLKPSEVSNFWIKQGFNFIQTHPLKYLELLGKKLYYFWNSCEIENDKNIYFFSRWSSLLRILLWDWFFCFPFGIISPLSILGIILCAKHWKKYFLIYAFALSYMLSVILFFVTSCFRLPVIPFLIIFASYSIYWLVEKIRNKQTQPLLISLSILMALFLITNSKLFGVKQTDLSRSYNNLGIVYSKKGWYDTAISTYLRGFEINPNSIELHLNLADAYYQGGYWNQAIEVYEEAITLDPTLVIAYNRLGQIYDRMNKDEEALQAYTRALEIDPALVKAHINLAFLLEKKELYEEAVNEYQKALILEPDVASIHNDLGNVYVKLNLKDEALIEFKEALRLDPNYVYAQVNLGNIYFEMGEYQMAITQYKTALKLDPTIIKAYLNLAITYVKTNQPYKAVEVLQDGLKTNPKATELKTLLEKLSAES
jgi:tetratricopeptide (TPR) repeat protein